jgi:hypothetical protein
MPIFLTPKFVCDWPRTHFHCSHNNHCHLRYVWNWVCMYAALPVLAMTLTDWRNAARTESLWSWRHSTKFILRMWNSCMQLLQFCLSLGLRNSEIRFGIGISEAEPQPYRTELFLEFRKVGISEFRLFQIFEFSTFYAIFFQDEMFSRLYIK